MNDNSSDRSKTFPQFSLRAMLLVMAGLCVFAALFVAVLPYLKHVNGETWFAIGCLLGAAIGCCLMVASIAFAPGRRLWATGLLSSALLYAVANIAVFAVTMSIDAFAIFHLAYIVPAGFIGPALAIAAMAFAAVTTKKLQWMGVAGFVVWTVSMGLAHLWVIAMCSASV